MQRLVHLGFEVRVELVRDDGETLSAQLTREQVEGARASAGADRVRPPDAPDGLHGLVGKPGVGVRRQLLYRQRQVAVGQVRDRDLLQHGAQVCADCDPDVA